MRLDRFQHHPWRAANESLDHLSLRELQGERGEHHEIDPHRDRLAIDEHSIAIEDHQLHRLGHRVTLRVHRYDLRIVNLSLPLSDALVHVSRASLQCVATAQALTLEALYYSVATGGSARPVAGCCSAGSVEGVADMISQLK